MKKLISITVFALVFLVTGISYAGLMDGLIAHYKFDGNADDISVNENDGTISGGVTFTDGIFNQAACFNGTNGYIEAPYHQALSLVEWSISAWVYPSVMPDDAILVGREDDARSRYNYALVLGPANFSAQYETAASDFDHIVTAPCVTPGTWYHAVATRSINGEHKIYLNGEVRDSGFWDDTPVQNNENLIIARYVDSYPNSDRFFNGCVDDVRIYNRALSDLEIQALYNEGQFLKDTMGPTGAVHAYPNLVWPPNNKMVTVRLDGYVIDEMCAVREGGGHGVSSAYLLINGTDKIILLDDTTDLLGANGQFSVDIEVRAVKGAEYLIEFFAADTNPDEPNSGLVDTTYIRVPHNIDGKQ